MEFVAGKSNENNGNYTLTNGNQVVFLEWSASPQGAKCRLTNLRNGRETTICRVNESIGVEESFEKTKEVVQKFQEGINNINKKELVDLSDLSTLDISQKLDLVSTPAEEVTENEESSETEQEGTGTEEQEEASS